MLLILTFLHNGRVSYKTNEKSFFEEAFEEQKEKFEELEEMGAKKVLKWYDFGSSKLRQEIKAKPAQYFFLFLTSFLGSVITSSVALIMFSGNLYAQFAAPKPVPAVASVSTSIPERKVPGTRYDSLLLASKLRANDQTLHVIDIRSAEEFKKGHITGAINLPVYGSKLVNDAGEIDGKGIKELFSDYVKSGKMIIIYAQNSYSTIPVDIVGLLDSETTVVKALAVGWEEWLHLQTK